MENDTFCVMKKSSNVDSFLTKIHNKHFKRTILILIHNNTYAENHTNVEALENKQKLNRNIGEITECCS